MVAIRSAGLVSTILEAAAQVLAKEGAPRFTTARVAEKAGAIYEGVQRRRIKVADKIYDAHMYALI